MARHGRFPFTLPDGRTIRGNFKIRGRYFKVSFPHPTQPAKYIETSTGIEVPKGFDRKKNPPADWFTESAGIIATAYAPTLASDPKTATWEIILTELAEEDLRPRALEAYTSVLGIFRRYVPSSHGPHDVTAEVAKAFTRKYQQDGFTRSNASDAKRYTRSAKTVENMVRRMSGLWSKIMPKFATSNPWALVKRPTVPKTTPAVPTEETVTGFLDWLTARYPTWELIRAFIEVKMVAGCRLNDLCQVKAAQFNHEAATLTILAGQDKTHRERVILLDAELAAKLARVRGAVYLWDRFLAESKVYRKATKTKHREEFTPELLCNAMKNVFREYKGGKLRSHGLRKRAITLTTLATQSVDATAQAFGLDPATARKYYLDANQAFNGSELLKRMAGVLRQSLPATPGQPEKEEMPFRDDSGTVATAVSQKCLKT